MVDQAYEVELNNQSANKFYSMNEKSLFKEVLERYQNYYFEGKKQIDTPSETKLTLYDIDYFKMNLNVLETFDEGEFTLANRLRFRRYYVNNTTVGDGMYTYCTEIVDVT